MAAPTLVGLEQAESVTINKPAGGTTGDLYVIYTCHESTADAVAVTGFASSGTGGVTDSGSTWLWRVYDGSEGSTFTITGSAAYTTATAFIVRGASTVISNVPEGAAAGTSDHVVSGLTTTAADTLVCVGWTTFAPNGSPYSPPAGYANLSVQASNSSYVWHATQASAGATGTVALSRSQGSTLSSGGLVAFSPSGEAAPFVAIAAPALWRRTLGLR